MSGGSMNYLYAKIEADAVFDQNTSERRAFAKHLELICKALHDIEWVDSGDTSPVDENEAIRACLAPDVVLQAAIDHAIQARDSLSTEIDRAAGIND